MAKTLNFNLNGIPYAAVPTKLERKKVYGWTELRVTSGDGNVCRQVGLDSSGQIIIPKGAIKIGSVKEDGSWMDKSELVAVHEDGTLAEPVASSFDEAILLNKKVSPEEFLSNVITSVYQLDSDSSAELISAIGDDIYKFPFSYRGGYEAAEGFLLANGNSAYIFVGSPAQFDFVGLEEQGVLDEPDDESEIDEDELDFNMM